MKEESKMPVKGKVALKDVRRQLYQLVDFNDSMNSYILFENIEQATAATAENNKEFLGKYIRVSLANKKELDIKTTIFVGNLYYKVKDEELRSFFSDCGEVLSVRIIRDPFTHVGKGFAYVRFKDKAGYLNGLRKNKVEFFQRELRIKRAEEIEQENKSKNIAQREPKPKQEYQPKQRNPIETAESIQSVKKDNELIQKFTEGRVMEDEMTEDRASNIYRTKGKIPVNKIRGQIKKVKKLGVSNVLR